jgi:RNA polymerase sigma-70 factor (ECF subfamily)
MAEDLHSNGYDLEIVSSVLQGNSGDFRKIVEKYQNTMYRLARSYLSNHEEAEDATQEVFLRAYKSLNRFNLEKRFLNWLYTIAINHLKSRYSRILRFQDKQERFQQEPRPAQDTPETETEQSETKQEIRHMVGSLPNNLKETVILYYYEEMSVNQIAEVLEISRENVKSRLFRARKKIRENLEKDATRRE